MRERLFSAAIPGVWLLHGMAFTMAVAYFVGAMWSRSLTIVCVVMPAFWVTILSIIKARDFRRATTQDLLFGLFLLVLLASLVFQGGGTTQAGRKYAGYLPFLVMVPYVCGRLMGDTDIRMFSRLLVAMGVAMAVLLLLEFRTLPQGPGRPVLFGFDHAPLSVGAVLATAVIALYSGLIGSQHACRAKRVVGIALLGLLVAALAFSMARGWLVATLVGTVAASAAQFRKDVVANTGLLAYVCSVAALSVVVVPSQNMFYSLLLTAPVAAPVTAPHGPILGEASCQPFKEGINSVAMRWVLYQEAWAMFREHPLIGVGAARFGEYSCSGPGGFAHSTVLQAAAELGIVGGGLFIALLLRAAWSIARHARLSRSGNRGRQGAFFVGVLFVTMTLAEQFYGNLFMMVGTSLLVGLSARLQTLPVGEVRRG